MKIRKILKSKIEIIVLIYLLPILPTKIPTLGNLLLTEVH